MTHQTRDRRVQDHGSDAWFLTCAVKSRSERMFALSRMNNALNRSVFIQLPIVQSYTCGIAPRWRKQDTRPNLKHPIALSSFSTDPLFLRVFPKRYSMH